MKPIFGLGRELQELKFKRTKNFFYMKYFWQKTKESYLMTETLMVQKVVYIDKVFLEGEWILYLLSVLRNMSYQRKKNVNFLYLFFCTKNKFEKIFWRSF